MIGYSLNDTVIVFDRIRERARSSRKLSIAQVIDESINQTLKAQLDLERHAARTFAGITARVLQRLLALTTAIWHNETTNRAGPTRSLTAYDH